MAAASATVSVQAVHAKLLQTSRNTDTAAASASAPRPNMTLTVVTAREVSYKFPRGDESGLFYMVNAVFTPVQLTSNNRKWSSVSVLNLPSQEIVAADDSNWSVLVRRVVGPRKVLLKDLPQIQVTAQFAVPPKTFGDNVVVLKWQGGARGNSIRVSTNDQTQAQFEIQVPQGQVVGDLSIADLLDKIFAD